MDLLGGSVGMNVDSDWLPASGLLGVHESVEQVNPDFQ